MNPRNFLKNFSRQSQSEQDIPDFPELDVEPEVLTKEQVIERIESALTPLDEVFLKPGTYNEVIESFGIMELCQRFAQGYAGQRLPQNVREIEGPMPKNSGAVLVGPPGTGKSLLQEAVASVFYIIGAFKLKVDLAIDHDGNVGSLERPLAEAMNRAIINANQKGLPSYVYFDDASNIVTAANVQAHVGYGHIQEGIDTLKRYISNYPQLVVGISSNADEETLDRALTRAGRLNVIYIGKPDLDQIRSMWKYFIGKYNVPVNVAESQLDNLADLTMDDPGSFIDNFCNGYAQSCRNQELLQRTCQPYLKDAMRKDYGWLHENTWNGEISFDKFCADARQRMEQVHSHDTTYTEQSFGLGKQVRWRERSSPA